MEDKLTKEEVLHVARLANIKLDDEEISNYQVKLKQILNEIEKINDLEVTTDKILISPTENKTVLRDDEEASKLDSSVYLENAPKTKGNFIEVPVVIQND